MPDPLQPLMHEARALIEGHTATPTAHELAIVRRFRAQQRAWYGDSLDELVDAYEREALREERGLPARPWDDDLPVDNVHGARYEAGANGTGWGMAALVRQMARVAAAEKGQRNETLASAAASIGRVVAGGFLDERFAQDELEKVALARGLRQSETVATIRGGFEFGRENPSDGPIRRSRQRGP